MLSLSMQSVLTTCHIMPHAVINSPSFPFSTNFPAGFKFLIFFFHSFDTSKVVAAGSPEPTQINISIGFVRKANTACNMHARYSSYLRYIVISIQGLRASGVRTSIDVARTDCGAE